MASRRLAGALAPGLPLFLCSGSEGPKPVAIEDRCAGRDGKAEAAAELRAGGRVRLYAHIFNGVLEGTRAPGILNCSPDLTAAPIFRFFAGS